MANERRDAREAPLDRWRVRSMQLQPLQYESTGTKGTSGLCVQAGDWSMLQNLCLQIIRNPQNRTAKHRAKYASAALVEYGCQQARR